ncbi:MAG: NgoFVII family restriction endonuclease [Leptospiraceae bacterium]|nr:NgoFVII family restriction endonuclease [Leptospiraceae bacterium]
MDNNIFSNSPFRKDFFRFAFEKYSKNCDLFIAVPFFSYVDPLLKALENNCSIKLIVRICPATSPNSLRTIFKNNNVAIRFFTSNSFHPKLYIFGNNQAILGSSNLTQNGFMKNQEINILINSDSDDFITLQDLFNDYWNYAEVLTEETLNKFENLNLSI